MTAPDREFVAVLCAIAAVVGLGVVLLLAAIGAWFLWGAWM